MKPNYVDADDIFVAKEIVPLVPAVPFAMVWVASLCESFSHLFNLS